MMMIIVMNLRTLELSYYHRILYCHVVCGYYIINLRDRASKKLIFLDILLKLLLSSDDGATFPSVR